MEVTIPCICPGAEADEPRHPDGDTVTLKDRLGWDEARAARFAMKLAASDDDEDAVPRRLTALLKQMVLSGVESWTLRNGAAIPVSPGNIVTYLFSHPLEADIVADAADLLYSEAVIVPLLVRASNFSPPTQTDELTSAPNGSMKSRQTRSSRSSISTTRTAGTARTTKRRAGGSSS